jgi:hypothetical protein
MYVCAVVCYSYILIYVCIYFYVLNVALCAVKMYEYILSLILEVRQQNLLTLSFKKVITVTVLVDF